MCIVYPWANLSQLEFDFSMHLKNSSAVLCTQHTMKLHQFLLTNERLCTRTVLQQLPLTKLVMITAIAEMIQLFTIYKNLFCKDVE